MIIIQFVGLLWLLVEYFSGNKFSCHFLSFCIHFEVCQFSARKRIWSVLTFETHSLVRNLHRIIQILSISEVIKEFRFHRDQCKMQIMYGNANGS